MHLRFRPIVRYELKVALRYLRARRKQAFISIVSFISMLGVGVGVMAVIVALAMMTGLQLELQDRIIGSNPHIFVWDTDGIADYHAEIAKLTAERPVPEFAPGDTVRVFVKVVEGTRERSQLFEGVCTDLPPVKKK